MKLTAVICTHNRCELLANAIDSINSADKPDGFDINILVIANACTDKTVDNLRHHHAHNLTFAEETRAGKSYALNHAINCVDSGYLCFIDDDQRVDKYYFLALAQALATLPTPLLLCGPLLPDWQGDEPQWLHDTGAYSIYPLPIPAFDLGHLPLQIEHPHQFPPGGQLIIHADVFKRVGLFNENLGPTGHNLVGSEDSEFIFRTLQYGEILHYSPEIKQYHYVDKKRLTLGYLLKMSFERNKSFTMISHAKTQPMPRYLWRQLFNYMVQCCIAFNSIKLRFFLMRIASTLGEIAAYQHR
jgi:glycosyltransferase involved in cell wall biosynthesis